MEGRSDTETEICCDRDINALQCCPIHLPTRLTGMQNTMFWPSSALEKGTLLKNLCRGFNPVQLLPLCSCPFIPFQDLRLPSEIMRRNHLPLKIIIARTNDKIWPRLKIIDEIHISRRTRMLRVILLIYLFSIKEEFFQDTKRKAIRIQ